MLKKFLLGSFLGVLAIAGVALAQVYYGYDPSTGLEVTRGAIVSGGVAPTLSGCATLSAKTGGASAGSFVTSGTSCNLVITYVSAAPNGWRCEVKDLTTPADTVLQTAMTTKTATFAGTTVAADKLLWRCEGF